MMLLNWDNMEMYYRKIMGKNGLLIKINIQ